MLTELGLNGPFRAWGGLDEWLVTWDLAAKKEGENSTSRHNKGKARFS